MSVQDNMPIIASNEGVWEGWYRYYNLKGEQTEQHRSRLLCRFLDEETYHQTNYYFWEDGRSEVKDFPTKIDGDKLVFYTHIDGWAAEVKLDTYNRTTMLNWTRHDEPGIYLYEMIQVSDDRKSRSRVWQWFKDGRLFQRTLIDENFVTRDWAAYDGSMEVPNV